MADGPEKSSGSKPARNALGQLLPGHTANPNGRPRKKTLEELVTKAIGPSDREIIAERLAQGVVRAAEKYEEGTKLGKFDIEILEWWLKREWPAPSKVEATVVTDERRSDAPLIPTEADREKAVATILHGDPDAEPNVEGTEKRQ